MAWLRTFFLGVAVVLLAGALMLLFPDMEWNGGENHFDTPDEAAFMAWLAALLVGPVLIGIGGIGCVVAGFVQSRAQAAASS